jgi:hypothetical protein
MSQLPADEEIARAQALGRLAAREGASAATCPYGQDTPADRVLAYRWVRAYTAAGGNAGIDYTAA